MARDISLLGAVYSAVPAVTLPTVGGGTATFYDDVGTKTIEVTENGTVTEDVTYYADVEVDVNVPNSYSASDEGKVVEQGELVSQSSATYTYNDTYDTTLIKSVTVNVSGGSPTLETVTKTYTPTESTQTEQITPSSGYDGLAEVDVTVNAIPSSYVGSGIDRNDSTDLTASGATVTAPAGYYASAAAKTVASGTAGTPTATKGTVSNHSVSVTPSVTNSAGYISSETKTGTAVTVSASELVSGTKSITANGTGIDVTDYAAVDVAVSGGGGSSGISTFDFTQGVTDQETGLYRFVLANATQDSTGLHIGASNAIASLSNLNLYDHVVEFKTGTLSKSYSTGHGRLYMSDGSNGIIYRNTNVWSVYGGSWTDSSQTSISYLQNAIIRIEYPSSGNTVSIYVNDTLLLNNVAFGPASSTSIMLGATGNAFYNATFEWLKIYTNEAYALKTLLGG